MIYADKKVQSDLYVAAYTSFYVEKDLRVAARAVQALGNYVFSDRKIMRQLEGVWNQVSYMVENINHYRVDSIKDDLQWINIVLGRAVLNKIAQNNSVGEAVQKRSSPKL